MPTISNGESGASVRTKLNTALSDIENLKAYSFKSRGDLYDWWVINGATTPTGLVVSDGKVQYVKDGGTAISDLSGLSVYDGNTPNHFATNSTPGTTDMEAAIESALSAGNVTLRPEEYSASGQISVPDNVSMTGGIGSVISRPAGAVAGPAYVFGGASGVEYSGFDVTLAEDTTATNGVYVWPIYGTESDVTIKNVSVDGNVAIEGGPRNYLAGAFLVSSSADWDRLTISDSSFSNLFYGFLQSNTTAGTQKNISVTGSVFDEFGSIALLFNAPDAAGLIENVLVAHNDLGNNRSLQPFTTTATINTATDVDTATDTITETGHGLSDGYVVTYSNGGGTSIGGLTSGNTYYIVGSTANTFQVAATSGGAAIDLTSTGSGASHTFAFTPTGYSHRGSFAGNVNYTRFIGNHAYGYGGELFRAEECKASAWVANTAKLDGKDGIEIIPNNADDVATVHTPTLFSLTANIVENVGLNSAPTLGAGLHLKVYTTSSGLADAEGLSESVVSANALAGWKYGIWLDQGLHRSIVTQNVTYGNTTADVGLYTRAPSMSHHDNMITDHDTAIQFERGGILGRQHFRWTGTPSAAVITVDSGVGVMTGWDWETGRMTVPSGSNEYEVITVGDKVEGRIALSVQSDDGTHFDVETGMLVWDGSAMTYTRDSVGDTNSASSFGFPATALIGVKNSNLTVVVQNSTGGDVDGIRLQVAFDGRHEWS